MANGWTPERKARAAMLIHNWRPWEKTTGPKSELGKNRSKMNAYRHGNRCAEVRRIEKALAGHHRVLRDFMARL